MNKRLNVYYGKREVGELWVDQAEIYHFRYTREWERKGFSIGRVLPCGCGELHGREVEYFWSNILPEGICRESIERELRTDGSDFALLCELGKEVAGALSLVKPGDEPPASRGSYSAVLKEEELSARLRNLPHHPILHRNERWSLSLAGAQNKMAVLRTKEGIRMPQDGAASNCILKIASADFPDLVFNEFICMRLAREVGLPCARVDLLRIGGVWALAVERYDRHLHAGLVQRFHQQDFCQMLGIPHSLKYEFHGGPGLQECTWAMREISALPVEDAFLLGQWYTFNLLIGNMDGHAKNISMLYKPQSGWRLSPFYDLVHTVVYEDIREVPAMLPCGREVSLRRITPSLWQSAMQSIGLPLRPICSSAREMKNTLLSSISDFSLTERSGRSPQSDVVRRLLRSLKNCIRSAGFLPTAESE